MENKIVEKQNIVSFVSNIINTKPEVIGPKKKDSKYAFGELTTANELSLDYDVTLLPPKETLIKFELGEQPKVEPVIEAKPRILFGFTPTILKPLSFLIWCFPLPIATLITFRGEKKLS